MTGLSCLAVTDHDTITGALEMRRIAPFEVIVGEEVTTQSGHVVGLFLEEEIPTVLPAVEAMKAIKEQEGLVLLPHPFDRFRLGLLRHISLEEVLPFVDAVEVFNARTLLPQDNRLAQELANHNGLIAVVGSDAHSARELGYTYLEMANFDVTPKAFLQALGEARLVTRRVNPLHRFASIYGRLRRFLGHA
jgi:predicted metal-dependent phosphoesterase TrpH